MEQPVSKSAKALAALLMVGGVVGIGITLLIGFQLAQANIVGGDVERALSFGIGATANVFVGTEAAGVAVGFNIVAIAALAFLLWRRSRPIDVVTSAARYRQSPDAMNGAQ